MKYNFLDPCSFAYDVYLNNFAQPIDPCNGATQNDTCLLNHRETATIVNVGLACGSIIPLQTSLDITVANGTVFTVDKTLGKLVLFCQDGSLSGKYAGINYTDIVSLSCSQNCVFTTFTDTNPPTELASICPASGKGCVLPLDQTLTFDAAAACNQSPNIVIQQTSR